MPSLKNHVIDGQALSPTNNFGGNALVRDSFKLGGVWRCCHLKGLFINEMGMNNVTLRSAGESRAVEGEQWTWLDTSWIDK